MSKPYVFAASGGRKFLVRCPRCSRENWTCAVASGVCCWCGYDANRVEAK